MVRKRKDPDAPGSPEVDPSKGIELLNAQLKSGQTLLGSRPIDKDAFGQWELITRNYLEKAFGQGSPNVRSVTDAGRIGSFPMAAGEAFWEEQRFKKLTTKLTRIEGLVELLKTEIELQNGGAVGQAQPARTGHRIFLVHGHDETTLQEVARFLEKLDQELIILREQPNRGRTIIEKFEDYSDVGFAIVLLTPDDKGGAQTASLEDQRFRARQNVILELGYFLGKLGRSRVCALFKEGVEIPSDYSGVLYIQLDKEGGWRLHLAKELKAAGLS